MKRTHPKVSLRRGFERLRLKLNEPFEVSEAIAIFGSPRSGTTWLMESLGQLPGYVSIFEPLHSNWFPASERLGFTPRTYLAKDHVCEDKRLYFERIFQGRVMSQAPHFKTRSILGRLSNDKILVKFIRANRMIPWILNNFKLKGNIIIVRHPCSTIASQLKTGIDGYLLGDHVHPSKETVLQEGREFLPEKILGGLEEIKTKEEILAAIWSMDQYVPLQEGLSFIKYEDLLLETERTLSAILKGLHQEEQLTRVMKNIDVPSLFTKDLRSKKEEQLGKWKQYLSKGQTEDILGVVELFDIELYP